MAVHIIDKIFTVKKPSDPFILSAGHAGLALYVVLEKFDYGNAEKLWKKHGTHPNRDMEHGIWASTGSLGHGIGIAVGMAMADPKQNVYVLMSDGECAEGSVWEALRIASDNRLENLRITVYANGYSAYGKVDVDMLDTRLQMFYPTLVVRTNIFALPDYLQGLDGHYAILTKEQYEKDFCK